LSTSKSSAPKWSVSDAEDLYGIRNWGTPYFSVSEQGETRVNLGDPGNPHWVSMPEIISELEERGIVSPVMLRFGNILDHRITLINESFRKAISDMGYQGEYRGVFPIKVNQQQQVIEEICRFGKRYHHGLEAGSKPELIAAISYMQDPEAVIICNGYKDAEFVDLALYGLKMGLNIMLVAEIPSEVDLVLERAAAIGVKPRLGVRMRLSTPGSGQWLESGGDRSVFGLNAAQVIQVVDTLRAADALDCLELLHYHLGSQIPNIRTIRAGASEAARVYTDLVREGAKMGFLDIGGGLAVDYDGTQSSCISSRNYAIEEYCIDVVESIMAACNQAKIPHPTIVSESGRATVAHYGVLVFNILDVGEYSPAALPEALPEGAPQMLRNLFELPGQIMPKNLQECYNDAVYYRDELRSMFTHGVITLRERGLAEQIFSTTVRLIADRARQLEKAPEGLRDLVTSIPDIYYGNFSLFQSLPDSWAIDQLFPVMPIHRLNEEPTREAVFADITCDCDGKIDRFIDPEGERRSLPLHVWDEKTPYYIGVFLVGAYQETLGDLHNLFGDTNVVSVELDEDNELAFSHEVQGDTVADVLSYVEYEPKDLIERFRKLAERAVRRGRISAAERRTIVDTYTLGMQGYTYFEA
jgi:arginine decarboxylase